MTRHITLTPSGPIDFIRAERDHAGTWFRSPMPAWIATLLPNAINAVVAGADFSFSTLRTFPFADPDYFSLAADTGVLTRIFAPIGEGHGDLWGAVLFHSADSPPIPHGEKFVAHGLRNALEAVFSTDRIDRYRKPNRPREEIWVRHHGLTLVELAGEDAFPLPGWARRKNPEEIEASAKQTAARLPMQPGDYDRLRRQEHAGQEAGASPGPADQAPPTPAAPAAVKRKERVKVVTQNAVRASAANEKYAEEFANKRVSDLEKVGKL